MRKNKLLTVYAVLVFAFLVIPLVIITITVSINSIPEQFPLRLLAAAAPLPFPLNHFPLNGLPMCSR